MSTFKKAKVVMLPTNQKAGLGSIYKRIKDDEIGSINEFDKIGNLYINKNPNVQKSNSNFEAQHLYIISDDEIKEGDWTLCLDEIDSTVMNWNINQCVFKHIKKGNCTQCKKIIATTDESLHIPFVTPGIEELEIYEYCILPKPSDSFIKKYIEEYNKGNIITDVLVEYNYFLDDNGVLPYWNLKVNPKDNTITIKKTKEIYTKDEVIRLLERYISFLWKEIGIHYPISLGKDAKDKFINREL